jgi:tRNA pseudouridine55 synthase
MTAATKRRVDGILLLDKPEGMSSNRALQRVKHLFAARKAGHTGSLDPLATGLLPLCFGEATKVSGFLLDANKRYRVTCRLGMTTTTGDREGEPLEHFALPALDQASLAAALARFTGPIRQVPPMYSALKHQGERLYKLARQGVEVERKPREVTVHAIELIAQRPDELELDVRCSKGTYIRTLCEDLANALGSGGHVTQLRRSALGPFADCAMVTMEQVLETSDRGLAALDALLLPVDAALAQWPALELSEDAAFYVRQGQAVWVPQAPIAEAVRLYGAGGVFLGMGSVLEDGRIAPKRLLAQS